MRLMLCILKAVIMTECIVSVVMIELVVLACLAQWRLVPGTARPVVDTLAFWPRLAYLAAIPGVFLGALARVHKSSRYRIVSLMICALASYIGIVGYSVASAARSANSHDWWALFVVGVILSAGFALFALPPLVFGVRWLERSTRPKSIE